MKEFKGTPFPWVKQSIGSRQVIISDGSLVNNEDGSITYQPVVDVKYINNDADARLIEAAPLLLEALQALYNDHKSLVEDDQEVERQAIEAIKAALGDEDEETAA